MFKERVKTSIIVILLLNCVFLTGQMWFKSGILGPDWPYFSFADLPFVRFFSSGEEMVSVPKENLSKPRKIVINDGELWSPYYNTDEAFDTLDDKTAAILKFVLEGGSSSEKEITYEQWISCLSEPGVYVEYPITVSPKMLSMVLGSGFERFPDGITNLKDAIILPAGENSVRIAIRDAQTHKAMEFYVESEELSFPVEVLAMYTDKYARDGYYEFAYSTLLMDALSGNVKVDDLVLFSDNDSTYPDIESTNPIENVAHDELLQSFSFAPRPLRHYADDFGAENYVENYATLRIFPDGYIEYSAVDAEKGIDLGTDAENQYEILNSAIDFTEKVWNSVSDEPLNVLVSGIEQTPDGHKFTFDYYYGGREIAVGISPNGREGLYHAVEIITSGEKIVSYRQYLRCYAEADTVTSQETFMPALDYFVTYFGDGEAVVITDLYPGYYDGGESSAVLKTTWLCEVNDSDERYPKK